MKKITYVIACAAFSLWMSACSGPRNTTGNANGNDGIEVIDEDEVKEEAKEAKEEVKEEAKEAGNDLEKSGEKAEDKAKEAGNAAEDAADDAGDELSEERSEFSSKTREKAQLLDQKINQLSEKIEQAGDKAKVNMKDDLTDLKTRRDKLTQELSRLDDSDGDGNAWEEIKGGVSSAFDDLEQAYNRVEKKLTDN